MTNPNRLTQGEAVVGGLIADDKVTTKSLTVNADATIHGRVTSVDAIDFDTATPSTDATARLKWNDTDGTLDLGMKGGNVTQQVGMQQFMPVKHADNNGLVKGRAVYFVGSSGINHTVRYASASAESMSLDTLGVIAETVTGGNKAFCATYGEISNIDTSTLEEGKVVWLSASPGLMTTTKPTFPNHLVQVGFCIRSSATVGVLFVSVQNGYEIDELHNVSITNPQEGDILVYSASAGNVWRNQQP